MILVSEVTEALRLHDLDLKVVVGELDAPETYRLLRTEKAALVATVGSDVINTNVAFTACEVSETVPIVATARVLDQQAIEYRIVEKNAQRKPNDRLIVGDAADLEILKQAGIMETAAVGHSDH